MEGEGLTFSELRKVQKEEKRQEELTELDQNFLLQVRNYLKSKKEISGEDREYRNAKRVFEKVVSIREDKIVRNAKIAAKSSMDSSKLEMLPFEQELFRELRESFERHREAAEERTSPDGEAPAPLEEEQEPAEPEEVEEPAGDEDTGDEPEDGYQVVKISSEVPEFMGTDLESYGPFEEGEQVEVPEDNAEILINRGNAEKL